MKNQTLFSSKDKSKKLKCCLLQFLFGTLRLNNVTCKNEQQSEFRDNFQNFYIKTYVVTPH